MCQITPEPFEGLLFALKEIDSKQNFDKERKPNIHNQTYTNQSYTTKHTPPNIHKAIIH